MAEEVFSSIMIEAYLSGAWVDISADVLKSPNPRVSGMGIMGNTIMDRIGGTGTLTFSLDNSEFNSAATLGYYTPEGINVRSGWRPGVPVRLSFAYDGYKKYKYYGTVDTDGIEVVPMQYGPRHVNVKCSNWMEKAANHTLELMSYQTNYRADQGIQQVLDNMTPTPQKVHLGVGANTYPTVFDITRTNTKAIGEIQKLVFSGLDLFYIRGGDETGEEVVYFPRAEQVAAYVTGVKSFPAKNSDFTDSILLETGGTDDILLETGNRLLLEHAANASFNVGADQNNMTELKAIYGKHMINHAVFVTYPRTVDAAAVVLYALETPIEIAAAETLTEVRGSYTDPNSGISHVGGIEMVIPVATTDYQMFQNSDGTGTDRTADLTVVAEYGTSEVRYTLTNNNAAVSYVTKLQARGKGVYTYDKSEKVYDSDTSITNYGPRTQILDMPYLAGPTQLFTFAEKSAGTMYNGGILDGCDDPEMFVDQVTWLVNRDKDLMLAFLFMEIFDGMELFETVTNSGTLGANSYWVGDQWFITGYEFEIVNGRYVKWMPMLKRTGKT